MAHHGRDADGSCADCTHGAFPEHRVFPMNGTYLRFYMLESTRHGHQLLYHWLLQHAKRMGVPGGSAFRAIEGFGRHGALHSEHFFELAGDLTIEVEFLLESAMADQLLASLRQEKVNVVYARAVAEIGVLGG
jgi:PII-like signaling protein